jgi:hypothetical protein
MTEGTFQIVRLCETEPFLDSCITFTLLVITLELISRHLAHTFCKPL